MKFPSSLPTCLLAALFVVLHLQSSFFAAAAVDYNVLKFGAKPDSATDSTKAFQDVWAAACATEGPAMIYVPKGWYMVGVMAFEGPCKSSHVTWRIDGTLRAPADYRVLGKADSWFGFKGVTGVSIIGGAFDGRGSDLWDCKEAGGQCPSGATTVSFTNSNNIKIQGLLSLNSQMFHIVINGCQNVEVTGVRIIASGESPNTDGIHVQLSRNVEIRNCSIKTGDDCISIGPGTVNLWVERVACGPGHGISIGSLAKDLEEEGVQNVTVKTTVFTGSTNGLRIKSWARPSTGFVQNVRFINSVMRYVQNPIIIDQNYCPSNNNCPGQESGVKISDVSYENIRGTSTTLVAIELECSGKNPCRDIYMRNVNLKYLGKEQAQSSCSNALGKTSGVVRPAGCL